jgi:hypothetical protein
VAGRRLAAQPEAGLAAGPHALDWAPATARPGLCWLSVRAGGRAIGTRALVLVR